MTECILRFADDTESEEVSYTLNGRNPAQIDPEKHEGQASRNLMKFRVEKRGLFCPRFRVVLNLGQNNLSTWVRWGAEEDPEVLYN